MAQRISMYYILKHVLNRYLSGMVKETSPSNTCSRSHLGIQDEFRRSANRNIDLVLEIREVDNNHQILDAETTAETEVDNVEYMDPGELAFPIRHL